MIDSQLERAIGRQLGQAQHRELVRLADQLVVRRVAECEREQALFLQVGLGDSREGAGDHDQAAQMAQLHRRVLAARTFAVVLVAHRGPAHAGLLVGARDLVDRLARLAAELVQSLARRAAEGVHPAREQVARDVAQVPAEAQPGPSRRDVIGGRLALRLEQQRQLRQVAPVPLRERRQPFQAVAFGHDDHFHVGAVFGRRDVARFAAVEAVLRQFVAARRAEAELAAVVLRDRVAARVEIDSPGEGRGHDQFGAADEGQGVAVGVVAPREVAVEGGHDRVLFVALDIAALPLADAGPAGVGQHGRAGLLERGQLSVALGRRADLLRAGRDQQRRAQFQPRLRRLARHIGRAADVLVGRVGA